jgi:hypothetical protein
MRKLLVTSSGNPPEDYRFFCFNGEVKVIAVDSESVINGVRILIIIETYMIKIGI